MTQNNIKLVVTDLDGTLLSPDRTISATATDTINRLQERGVLFTFITGRPPYAIERFATQAPPTAPIVCCNGAVIVQGDSLLYKRSFSPVQLQPVLHRAVALGLTVLVYTDGTEYTLAPTQWTAAREAVGRPFPLYSSATNNTSTAEKVNIMAEGSEHEFASLLGELKELTSMYGISIYGNTGCEIVDKDTSKATGLLELCRLTNTVPSQVLAIGDNENDHPMLRLAGIGVAVANATVETKSIADYCCMQPNTDGFVEAVNKFVFEETAT